MATALSTACTEVSCRLGTLHVNVLEPTQAPPLHGTPLWPAGEVADHDIVGPLGCNIVQALAG